ncbi:MAG: sn-glycerol-1-phosphate dehydrogenase [Alphaproteobacteria bacterium]|jgi:glycerol-1-phosphate dehydrogenase [NAD(P)+]|nr:sn-glycerol-1-phosphate dehydrogenase [Pseudomonadota bacterium]
MARNTIERLLDGGLPDPDGGPPLSVPTRHVAIADSLDGGEAELVASLGFGGRLAVVTDENTRSVLGERVLRALGGIAQVTDIRLPGRPHADGETVEAIRRKSSDCDALIAVGAGTINDLCKYSAAQDGKPYAVFATAPSMNGYTSVNAAINVSGHKKSLPATAARGVFMDLAVLSQAPPRMIRSGLGDSICRPTAQADWLLAHLLLDRPYREAPFSLLTDDEPKLFAHSEALMAGDLAAMHRLARTLTLSGFGMTICGGSYPASQGEHLISHYVEMLAPPDWPEAFHGEQIGVTTLSMARLQERLIEGGPPRLGPSAPDESSIAAHFGAELGAACWAEFQGKRLDAERAKTLNVRLAHGWDEIRARLRAIMLPAARLEAVLKAAGAPTTPEELGWPRGFYLEALRHAREIRNRYTFLDLAADSGVLQDAELV